MGKAKRPVVKATTQRRQITITKSGKPVARLALLPEKRPDIFGRMKGTVEILGDIVSPTGEIWDAGKDSED
jgi:antitoxin (DNA-binding transcriptional repressor) of toxin-antitoxin stability system